MPCQTPDPQLGKHMSTNDLENLGTACLVRKFPACKFKATIY